MTMSTAVPQMPPVSERIEVVRGVYNYTQPIGAPAPSIFDIPRSGREYPPGFYSTAPFNDVHFLVSHYVEEIWGLAPRSGSGLLYALFVNNYIDANRSEHDIDPDVVNERWPDFIEPTEKSSKLGMGLIHTKVRGHVLHLKKLSVEEIRHRIEGYWRPYHNKLAALIEERRRRAGVAYHLSCHCMGTVGPSTAHDYGKRRADFCLSDRDGTTSSRDFIEMIAASLRKRGYGVTFNDPFKGAESIRLHGKPHAGVHSVQIEVIKELFMDEETFERKPDFTRVQTDLGEVAADIAAYARSEVTR
jgi:N-formylglutamate deformylase